MGSLVTASFRFIVIQTCLVRTLDYSSMSSTKTNALVITVVTGNAKKLEEISAILGLDRLSLRSEKIELPELQGEPEDIVTEKCRIAAERVSMPGPVLVDDTSLCYNALNGLPGPYVKWFLDKTGHDGLNRILAGYEDKSAYAQCIFAFTFGKGQEIQTFTGRTNGKIVPARGPTNFGWDPVFLPDGFDQTYAEMPKSLKNSISHRYKAAQKLKEYLIGFHRKAHNVLEA